MTTLIVPRDCIDFGSKTLLPEYLDRLDVCIRTDGDGLLDRDSIAIFESEDTEAGVHIYYVQFDCYARPACLRDFSIIDEADMLPAHLL